MIEPLEKRLHILIENIEKLVKATFPNKDLKIGYTTIFAKDEADYETLRSLLNEYGWEEPANNGLAYHIEKPIKIGNTIMMKVRVRKPDVHRPELGCCDLVYKDSDYKYYREKALEIGLDIILRKDYEMIELSTRDIPAYAYLVKNLA